MKIMNANKPLDLRKLRHAIALSEFGTFASASRELYITQSALTRSIQALEDDLGVELFERSTSGVTPTSVGKSLLRRAQSLLLQANGLRHDAHLFRDARLGSLTFGIGPMLATWAASALSVLAKEALQVDIRVEIEPSHRLQEMLLEEEIEFFIADVSQLTKDPRLVEEKIGAMEVGYFVRQGHPLASRRNLTLQDIQEFPLITPGFRTLNKHAAETAGWRGKISCENTELLKFIALNSDGVILAAKAAIISGPDERQFSQLYMRNPLKRVSDLRVVALAERSRSPLAQRIISEFSRNKSSR